MLPSETISLYVRGLASFATLPDAVTHRGHLPPVRTQQLDMAGEVVGPVPGNSPSPLRAQGPAQFFQDMQPAGFARVLQLVRPQWKQ